MQHYFRLKEYSENKLVILLHLKKLSQSNLNSSCLEIAQDN